MGLKCCHYQTLKTLCVQRLRGELNTAAFVLANIIHIMLKVCEYRFMQNAFKSQDRLSTNNTCVEAKMAYKIEAVLLPNKGLIKMSKKLQNRSENPKHSFTSFKGHFIYKLIHLSGVNSIRKCNKYRKTTFLNFQITDNAGN